MAFIHIQNSTRDSCSTIFVGTCPVQNGTCPVKEKAKSGKGSGRVKQEPEAEVVEEEPDKDEDKSVLTALLSGLSGSNEKTSSLKYSLATARTFHRLKVAHSMADSRMDRQKIAEATDECAKILFDSVFYM